jgi:hypothetical protein
MTSHNTEGLIPPLLDRGADAQRRDADMQLPITRLLLIVGTVRVVWTEIYTRGCH